MASAKKSTSSEKKDLAGGQGKDTSSNYEFGGPLGALALMIWSHYILLYFWYSMESANGLLIVPTSVDSLLYHLKNFSSLFMEKAIPSATVWIAYSVFSVTQLVLAAIMPGMTILGVPTEPEGKRLPYHCNGYLCYYFCVTAFVALHYSGIFPGTHLADNVGQYLVASMIIANVTSVYWYVYGLYTTDPKNKVVKLTGNIIYDFFMGSVLYPRIGEVDIKMVAEARWSWLTLMLLTLSCALKQYETTGRISKEMGLILLAHWLYSNATVKGEQYIPCTWDMFHEKFGWMLNFWNFSGVPFMYCLSSFFVLNNQEYLDGFSVQYTAAVYVLLLFGYWVFDSANSQKANCKIKIPLRKTFPRVFWGVLKDPKFLKTPKGDLLIDGWYAFARKMQYTGDILMALSWGLNCGFRSPTPYFYFVFFTLMIIHRQTRDEVRCKQKYGEHWDRYVKLVPNVFIPSPSIFVWLFTGKKPHLD